MQSHIRKVYAVICRLPFWQNDLLGATAVTWGWNNTEIRVSRESWRKFSCRSCRDSNQRPFNHESGALTTELSPLPLVLCSLLSAVRNTACILISVVLVHSTSFSDQSNIKRYQTWTINQTFAGMLITSCFALEWPSRVTCGTCKYFQVTRLRRNQIRLWYVIFYPQYQNDQIHSVLQEFSTKGWKKQERAFFPAPSSRLYHNWLRHWSGTPSLRAPVHRRRDRPPKGLGTNKTVEATI